MHLEDGTILRHEKFQGDYRLLVVQAPAVAPKVRPGQFVHVRIPRMEESVLRRPFSVFKTEGPALSLLYKAVGRGTRVMKTLSAGEPLNLMGPLGRGFPVSPSGRHPVLVAGGYGMAALFLLARELPTRGDAFFGGATAADILCVDDFERLGWAVHVATEDGSRGVKGLVTDSLDAWLESHGGEGEPEFFACGPNAMLRAVARRAEQHGCPGWVSVDRNMGCGVGACLTCVVKVRTPGDGWAWARSCREGPVFECREIIWDE